MLNNKRDEYSLQIQRERQEANKLSMRMASMERSERDLLDSFKVT